MSSFPELFVLSFAMGFSIFLALPIVLLKAARSRTMTLLNAAAIGILVFLLADIFSDVAPIIYSSGGYIANGSYATAFFLAVALCFGLLFLFEHRPNRTTTFTPLTTSLVVAIAIGFQNLTEGLVFGAAWAAGAVALSTVVFVGFFLQNITEGFPITSPLLGRDERRLGPIVAFFLVGGVPTILGGVAGYFYNSQFLVVVFDALAIGAILYCLLPMLRVALRPADPPEATYVKQRLVYLGVVIGFLLGFAVNAV
jgi:zinc transporter, ZIP family